MRAPDEVIGSGGAAYMLRWYLLRRKRVNIYLHKFLRSDKDRELHDHPWWNISVILWGWYWEETPKGLVKRCTGSITFRRADSAHRIILPSKRPVWTLFITGRKTREWGFHCLKGWRHNREFHRKGCQ